MGTITAQTESSKNSSRNENEMRVTLTEADWRISQDKPTRRLGVQYSSRSQRNPGRSVVV